ncbi:hypothetical protein [Paenibacillus albus]|uniref:hypothetical protein n=1 Tax=Paenibacillus albus TaxID=2495582 RepID=UPI0013DE9A6D|nr:hypothetical protein [Paenibacillus albus]
MHALDHVILSLSRFYITIICGQGVNDDRSVSKESSLGGDSTKYGAGASRARGGETR